MAIQEPDAGNAQRPGLQVTEHAARILPGLRMLVLGIAVLLAGVALAIVASHHSGGAATAMFLGCALVLLAGVLLLRGLTAVVAGKARVVQLFGRYREQSASPACSGSTRLPPGSSSRPGSATRSPRSSRLMTRMGTR